MKPFPQSSVRALISIPLALLLLLAGCDLAAIGEQEQIANIETIRAGTPSPTPSPTITNTPAPTATLTPTVGPSPTPSATPTASPTPLPPTPTPNPALAGFSFCDQQAGARGGRFSARLLAADASGTPAYEQVVLRFELATGSGPLGAEAACLSSADLAVATGVSELDGAYAVRVSLPGWLRDEAFRSSPISGTLSFSGTRTLTSARLVPADTPDAGADLLIGLSEPLPFRLSVERNPTRLTLAVARSSPIVGSSDQLRLPAGGGAPQLATPRFVIFDGDIWRVAPGLRTAGDGLTPGAAGAENLTDSPETETALAVSPDGTSIAFCRAAPGLDPADVELPVPSTLWVMDANGDGARPLAQVGLSCADPAFSPDGASVAFAVDETGAMPVQRTIYTVPLNGGQAERLIEGNDEWSRYAPQWLADGAVVFAATAPDGRSTLFLRSATGEVSDVGASILVPDSAATPYRTLGRPLAARDGSRFAVEAVRGNGPGADLVILDASGKLLERIGTASEVAPTPTPTASPSPTATRTPMAAGTTTTPATSPTAATPAATNATTPATGTATRSPTAAGTATTPTTPAAGTATRSPTAASTATALAASPTATPSPTAEPDGTPTATATLAPTPEPEPVPEPRLAGPYWTRPLAWDEQGRLLYVSTLCASQVVQDYQLYRWAGARRSELLLTGQSFGGIGDARMADDQLVYVLTEQTPPGSRGPQAANPRGAASLWLWDTASGARGELLQAERDINALAR